MTSLDFLPFDEKMAMHIADNMRSADITEVLAAGAKSPLHAIMSSVEKSQFTTIVADDTPLVIYGMTMPTMLTGKSMIWMLGTNDAMRYKKELIVYTRQVFNDMFQIAEVLYNYVHIDNDVSIRWLKHLGAEFQKPIRFGKNGEYFTKFEVRKCAALQQH